MLSIYRTRKYWVYLFLLLFLCFWVGVSTFLTAQSTTQLKAVSNNLWPLIEARLERSDVTSLNYFIFEQVNNQCGKDYDCLYANYEKILSELELRNQYWIAVPVAEEMVKLAQAQENLKAEADALSRLIALYGFVENRVLESQKYQELLQLYERMGDIPAIIRTKAIILEGRAWYLGEVDEILPELEALVAQSLEQGLTETANHIRIRLKYLYGDFGYIDKLAQTVEALENIPISDPITSTEAPYALHAATGRADLLVMEQKYDQAASLYQRALAITRLRHRAHHDTWSEVYVLLRLAKLERERGNSNQAKSYLDTAYTIASEANLYDRKILVLEMQTQIAEAENRFANALQYTREKYQQQAILDSLSGGFDVQRFQLQLVKEQLTAEKERQTLELRLRKNQLRNALIITILLLLLVVGLFVILRIQKQSKDKLATQNTLIKQQAEQLKNLDVAKSRFFANVSHELRTPLTLMLGPVRTLLKENQLTEQQAKLLRMADRNGKQLQQLVNEILDLQKLEVDKLELHVQPTKLAPFFRQHFAQFESLAAYKQINFSYIVQLKEQTVAQIDQEKCRQMVYNLLSNAFKFTPAGGSIEAKLSVEDNKLVLSVTDSGSGIHPDDLPHVFDRYFQTNRPEKPMEGGMGIGLALSQEYAKLLGGDITLASTLGKYTTFRLTFPIFLLEDTEATIEPEQEAVDPLPFTTQTMSNLSAAKPTILVVEDNLELQDYLRLILSKQYHIIIADNGQAALDRLQTNGCQLILSDLMMPVMDGYQLLAKLKSSDATRHIPVMMLTARADVRDKLRALRIGVDDYLIKPFEEEELKVRIANLLRNQAARQTEATAEVEIGQITLDPLKEDQAWLETFETYVQKNLASDMFTVSTLAAAFSMSESSLLRQLKRLTGLTPLQYLQEMRLDQARQLLENRTYKSIAKIAAEVGYTDSRAFSRAFKNRFGKIPSDFLNS